MPGCQPIAVVGASGRIPHDELERGVAILRGRGHEVLARYPPGPPSGYLAGSDEERLAGLVRALTDPQVGAVWAARGGYGAMRLLPLLPWERLARVPPRWVVGFSDVTALLLPLVHRAPGWGLVHGPNVCGLGRLADPDGAALWSLLEQGRLPELTGLVPLVPGEAEGVLIGGNLCLISHLAGTPFLPPPTAGRLLLLEDVGERPYRLDRMLTQLGLAGWLEGVAGVLLGELRGCDDEDAQGLEVVAEQLRRWLPGVPVLAGLPVGHGPRNHPLRLGCRYLLDARAGTLTPLLGEVRDTAVATSAHGGTS